ncbi:MAG: hypothetical protein M3463_10145 [Verrucomicrobiota bacterium]|nr:hypothetical protein [Verrucomicrobiota bacterium]
MNHFALLLSLLIGFHTSFTADSPTTKANEPRTVRLLTVGNSFSGNATQSGRA